MPVVLRALKDVPSYFRMTSPPPPASAYELSGFHATAKRGCPVPEERTVIWPETWYNSAVPLSPTSRAELPCGFQPIERILLVLGSTILVTPVPLYLKTSPLAPAISAYEPSGLQATLFRLVVPAIPDETLASWVLS